MTKFELPEKPKKTNTSEDFNNLRKAVDELDKFDYTWKTYANKADRRTNAANKYIEELERENQRLVAENLGVKTLVDNAKPQQALPVVPECVAEWIEHCKGMGYDLIAALTFKLSSTMHEELSAKILKWLGDEGNNDELFARAWLDGYTVEKPQLFKLIFPNSTAVLQKDGELNSFADTVYKRYLMENAMTEQEIKSIDERYWQFAVPVEDGE